MQPSLFFPICALLAFALYRFSFWFIVKRQYAAKARELGCSEAPIVPGGGFLGTKHVKRLMKADKNKLFPDMLVERQQTMSRIQGRECSTYKFEVLGIMTHFTSDPENIKAMLSTQFNDFYLGPARRGNMIRTLGDGIFVQDGKQWEHSRALLRPNFVREQVADLELEEHHVQNLFKAIGPASADGWSAMTNIQELFFRLTIDSATEFLFGKSVDSQIHEMPGNASEKAGAEKAFARNFDEAQMHMATGFRLGDLYWTHNTREYKQNNKVVKEFIEYYVDLALRKRMNPEKKMEEGLKREKYVFLEAIAQETQDRDALSAQLRNILLAGRDTTASLLSWVIYELLRDQRVFDKLRSTIIETFGTYDKPNDISFSTLKGCQYLRYCLNETLRLWPIVTLNGRRSSKATTLPRGGGPDGKSPIFLAPESEVQYSVHVMQRRQDLWGEDADQFKPERFIDRRSGWEYLPFNGGPRICIGQQLALTEASYVIVRLLQKYDRLDTTPQELEGPTLNRLTLTVCPGRPITLRLHEASE